MFLIGQTDAVQRARHDDVRKQHVDRRPIPVRESIQRDRCVRPLIDLVAKLHEHRRHGIAYLVVVIDHKYPGRSGHADRAARRRPAACGGPCRGGPASPTSRPRDESCDRDAQALAVALRSDIQGAR